MEERNMVTVTYEDFSDLIESQARLEILEDSLMTSAKLSYDGESLRFDADAVRFVCESVIGIAYMMRLNQLQILRKEEREEREKRSVEA